MKPKKILVIRFRQMGDAILATPLLNTLHAQFPDQQPLCAVDQADFFHFFLN